MLRELERQSEREMEAQLQSRPVLCRIIRAEESEEEECCEGQLLRLRRWWSQGRGAVSRETVEGGRDDDGERRVTGLSRYLERRLARGEREGRMSEGGC